MNLSGLPMLLIVLVAAAGDADAGSPPALWQARTQEGCRIALLHEYGDVEVRRVRGHARVDGDASFSIEAQSGDDGTRLAVRRAEARGTEAAGPLRLQAPRDCALEIRTTSGHVVLHGRHEAPVAVETRTGEVLLCAEARADLRVELATSGEMGADYSIAIEHMRHQEPDKQGLVTLGEGRIRARLQSRRGAVSVLDRKRAECD